MKFKNNKEEKRGKKGIELKRRATRILTNLIELSTVFLIGFSFQSLHHASNFILTGNFQGAAIPLILGFFLLWGGFLCLDEYISIARGEISK